MTRAIISSVLDRARTSLEPEIWDLESETPRLREEVAGEILGALNQFLEDNGWLFELNGVYLIGSSATVQWAPKSDIDITVVVSPEDALDTDIEEINHQARGELNRVLLIGQHPVNFRFRNTDNPIDVVDAMWDIVGGHWIKAPSLDAVPEAPAEDALAVAFEWAQRIDLERGELSRDLIDYEDLLNLFQEAQQEERGEILSELDKAALEVSDQISLMVRDLREVREDRAEAFERDLFLHGEPVPGRSRNLLPAAVAYKYLEKYRYMRLLKDLKEIHQKGLSPSEEAGEAREVISKKTQIPNIVHEIRDEPHLYGGDDEPDVVPSLRFKEQEREKAHLRRKDRPEKHMQVEGKSPDKIPGGLSDGMSPEDFDSKSLEKGIKVELEHTSDRQIATEVAMDHLVEDEEYYEKLEKIEAMMRGRL